MNYEIFFPNSSITGIAWAELLLFILPFLFYYRRKSRILLILVIPPILAVLLFSNSRSGWLGFAAGVIFLGGIHLKVQQRKLLLFVATFSLFFLLIVSIWYKSDSSKGRLHIYALSGNILKENWVAGVGIGKFKTVFNKRQADYFSQSNIDNHRAVLADNTFYAFNEYLQWVTETGVTGFLLLLFVLWLLWQRSRFLLKEHGNKPLLIASVSSLICVAIASLVNYPLHVIPTQLLTLICIGTTLFYPLRISCVFKRFKIVTPISRAAFLTISCFFFLHSYLHIKSLFSERKAFELQRAGYKTEALNKYERLTKSSHRHGYNFYFYAERLFFANRLLEAQEAINKCLGYYTDNNVYRLKAQIEAELGKYEEAENSYLRAIYMVPNRMGSRFDLMNFYISLKDTSNARYWASSLMNMPVKVPSKRVDIILKATKDSLLKWDVSNY